MNRDSSRSLSSSFLKFLLGTSVSRLTGLAREVIMAAAFGVGGEVAAFWMAFRFAHLFRRIFGEGALNVAFIPHFESLKKEEREKGIRFFYHLSHTFTFILLALVIGLELILGTVNLTTELSPGNKEVIFLSMILLPVALFISLYALNSAFLNCENSYLLPSIAPSLVNILWIGAALFLWKVHAAHPLYWLAVGVTGAFVAQWAMTALSVRKQRGAFEKGNHRESWRALFSLFQPIFLSFIGVTATQINSALDSLFARFADSNGPAYLWYALRLQQLPLALFGVGITNALLPPLSRAMEEGSVERFCSLLRFSINRLVLFMIPATAFIGFLGPSIVNLVYRRGAFSLDATLETCSCLVAYSLGLLPMSMVLVASSAFYAEKNYRLPAFATLYTVGLNGVLNALFVFVFHWGSTSIAIATSLASLFNLLLLFAFLKNKENIFDKLHLVKVVISSVSGGVLTTLFTWRVLPANLEGQLLLFVGKSLLFGCGFFVAAYFLRLEAFFELFPNRIKKFFLPS